MIMEVALGMSEAEANDHGWRGTNEGSQMKTDYGWNFGGDGTNSSGFYGLPSGFFENYERTFYNAGLTEAWWTSSPSGNSSAWHRNVEYSSGNVLRINGDLRNGLSVRCLKDAE